MGTGDGQVAIAIDNPDKFSEGWWGELSEKLGYSEAHPDRVWQSSFGEDGISIKILANKLGEKKAPSLFKAIQAGDIQGARREVYGLNGLSKYGGGKVEGLKKWWNISNNQTSILRNLHTYYDKKKQQAGEFIDSVLIEDGDITSNRSDWGSKRPKLRSMLRDVSNFEDPNNNSLFKRMVSRIIESNTTPMMLNGKVNKNWNGDNNSRLTSLLNEWPEFKQGYNPKLEGIVASGKEHLDAINANATSIGDNETQGDVYSACLDEIADHEAVIRGVYRDIDKLASSTGINAKGNYINIYRKDTVLSAEDARENLPMSFLETDLSGMKPIINKYGSNACGLVSRAWQIGPGVVSTINKLGPNAEFKDITETVFGVGGTHQSFLFYPRLFSEHSGTNALRSNSTDTYNFESIRGQDFVNYYNSSTNIDNDTLGYKFRSNGLSGVGLNETRVKANQTRNGFMLINGDNESHYKIQGSKDNDVFRLRKNNQGNFELTIINENGEYLVNRADNNSLSIDSDNVSGALTSANLPSVIFPSNRGTPQNQADTSSLESFLDNNTGSAFFRQFTSNGGPRHEFFGANSVFIDHVMSMSGKRQPGLDITSNLIAAQ